MYQNACIDVHIYCVCVRGWLYRKLHENMCGSWILYSCYTYLLNRPNRNTPFLDKLRVSVMCFVKKANVRPITQVFSGLSRWYLQGRIFPLLTTTTNCIYRFKFVSDLKLWADSFCEFKQTLRQLLRCTILAGPNN